MERTGQSKELSHLLCEAGLMDCEPVNLEDKRSQEKLDSRILIFCAGILMEQD
jgi:hypothetical protein